MEDPVMFEGAERSICPQCGAVLEDDTALWAHREEEHLDEALPASSESMGERISRAREGASGRVADDDPEHGRESPRPTEPAP
ncbi:MAG: hypothetical protein O2822_08140 [Chloroflexi bacterium]|nr:hypothetical protein [Chloroflexota bacterium]